MAIPLGFEEFSLEEINENFCLETFHSNRKELVLIAAPADFDVAQLKGETVILNGSTPLTKLNDQEEETMQWELHSTRTTNQQHSNLLLPSKIECKHSIQGPGLGVSVNVVRSMKIPHIKYPKKQKEITRLPKPDYLRIRWKPFGSGKPMKSKKFESEGFINSSISKKLSLFRPDKIKYFSQSDGSEEKKKKKKKKKKHSEEQSSGTHHEVMTNEKTKMNLSQRDKHVSPNKKSKEGRKVPNMISNKNEKLDKSPHKKKKKKSRKHSDSDLNSEDENRLFGVSGNTKKQQESREEQSNNGSLSSDRKKRKRKHSMETNNFDDVLKNEEHLQGENVQKKKKKKKK
ncbi:transcriptional regulator ATRX homolog [Hydractinia symbiolongicarpus]|uniref:transcriptional regulator ATRX homolog n=1 Tax=Hydractinia symbiolongicarpus TaxID=13093 RepID=UPI002550F38E|nr:transcriptional regulator ATRX homolog [Hydractinia symbiolongicarpus]